MTEENLIVEKMEKVLPGYKLLPDSKKMASLLGRAEILILEINKICPTYAKERLEKFTTFSKTVCTNILDSANKAEEFNKLRIYIDATEFNYPKTQTACNQVRDVIDAGFLIACGGP